MQSFVGLIGLIQPQAFLDLLLGLVLAHLWSKEPHKNIHSFRPCKSGQGGRKQNTDLRCPAERLQRQSTLFLPPTSVEEEKEDPLGRSKSKGLAGPGLSFAALPPPRRNWIRQSQTATQHNHDHPRRREGVKDRLAHLTPQRPPPPYRQRTRSLSFLVFYPQKYKRNTFPDQKASGKVSEYPLPPHPNDKEFSTPPLYPPRLPSPSTFLLLPALHQMALSLQTMCPFRNLVPTLSKPFQGHCGSSPSPSQGADPTPDTTFFFTLRLRACHFENMHL